MRKTIDNVNQLAEMPGSGQGDVLEALHAVMHTLRGHHAQALADAGASVSPLEGRVLAFFARHPGATQSDLAAHTGRDKGQLARLISGLRSQGLLDAVPDETDRRNLRLHLAPPAQAVHEALQRQRRQMARRAAAGLSADERQQLVALLGRVQGNLQGP